MAVYMPILELYILFQMYQYSSKENVDGKYITIALIIIWSGLVTVELLFPSQTSNIQWVATVLWCIETFPQLWLNAKLRSGHGQSSLTVAVTVCGKSTDMFSAFFIKMPLQVRVLCFFSTSTAYIDALQVIWYQYQSIIQQRQQEMESISVVNGKDSVEFIDDASKVADHDKKSLFFPPLEDDEYIISMDDQQLDNPILENNHLSDVQMSTSDFSSHSEDNEETHLWLASSCESIVINMRCYDDVSCRCWLAWTVSSLLFLLLLLMIIEIEQPLGFVLIATEAFLIAICLIQPFCRHTTNKAVSSGIYETVIES